MNEKTKPAPEDYRSGRIVVSVVLDSDVAKRFPDSAAVNDALRRLIQLADALPAAKEKRRTKTKASA
jgi:hypothetical protein